VTLWQFPFGCVLLCPAFLLSRWLCGGLLSGGLSVPVFSPGGLGFCLFPFPYNLSITNYHPKHNPFFIFFYLFLSFFLQGEKKPLFMRASAVRAFWGGVPFFPFGKNGLFWNRKSRPFRGGQKKNGD